MSDTLEPVSAVIITAFVFGERLDATAESILLGGLSASSRGKTVILVTQHARLAALADRVVTLERGMLTASPRDPVAGATAAATSSGRARRLAPSLAGEKS